MVKCAGKRASPNGRSIRNSHIFGHNPKTALPKGKCGIGLAGIRRGKKKESIAFIRDAGTVKREKIFLEKVDGKEF